MTLNHKKKKIFQNQIRETLELIEKLEKFNSQFYLENEIKQHLSRRKYLGSRDRRFIKEMTFSYFRWFGIFPKNLNSIEKIYLLFLVEKIQNDELDFFFLEHKKITFSENFVVEIKKAKNNQTRINIINHYFAENFRPRDLFSKWMWNYLDDEKIDQIALSTLEKAPLWLRLKQNFENFGKQFKNIQKNINLIKQAAKFSEKINILDSEEYKKGFFEIQDLGSQAICEVCAPKNNEIWWDACTGAGGKALTLAENAKSVDASDIREKKFSELKKRQKRAGQKNISIFFMNLENDFNQKKYDGVLVDAPCSASGTWRRRPTDKLFTTEKELKEFQYKQKSILSNAAKSVKSGGVLVYATCSVFNFENEAVIKNFLKQNPDFKLEKFQNPIFGEKTDGMLQLYTHLHDSDAMFMAKLRRK